MKKTEAQQFERGCSAPWSHEIPLFCAAESGNAECVRQLLDAGADPTVRDNSHRTAIYEARSLEVLQVLVKVGVPLEDADQYKWSPLVNAVSGGRRDDVERVRALIEVGANVNAAHDRGYTVFMSAVGSGRDPEILRMLVAAGADPHAVSELGFNAFHAAIDVNGAASNAEESVRSTFSYLKELGVNIEHRNDSGCTPLASAINHGTGTVVQVLCELGADPNAVCPMMVCGQEHCSRTDAPLIFHAGDGTGVHSDIKVESLLKAGADPSATDTDGHTPLVRAVAALCAQGEDYAGMFRAFFQGLHQVRSAATAPAARADYIAGATAIIRPYVEQFASTIPVPQTCQYDAEWRTQRISGIVLLAAYQGWQRRTKQLEEAVPEDAPTRGHPPPSPEA